MARSKVAYICATALFVAAFITLNTWTVGTRHEDGWRARSATGTIHRSGLSNVY
jgi:hypothetical protein